MNASGAFLSDVFRMSYPELCKRIAAIVASGGNADSVELDMTISGYGDLMIEAGRNEAARLIQEQGEKPACTCGAGLASRFDLHAADCALNTKPAGGP